MNSVNTSLTATTESRGIINRLGVSETNSWVVNVPIPSKVLNIVSKAGQHFVMASVFHKPGSGVAGWKESLGTAAIMAGSMVAVQLLEDIIFDARELPTGGIQISRGTYDRVTATLRGIEEQYVVLLNTAGRN
jgi:hypothetical protein